DPFELLLHPVDDIQGVLAAAHHHDAADHVPPAVEVHDPPPDVGPQADLSHVAHQDRSAAPVVPHDDVLEVGDRADVAAPAHHVLGAGNLHQASAHVVIPLTNGLDHARQRDLESQEGVRIDVDLILLFEAADGHHLRNAGNALQPVTQ